MHRTLVPLALTCAVLVVGCGTSHSGSTERGTGSGLVTSGAPLAPKATVVGTAVDARTGKALKGVEVAAPDGSMATTDEHGRFELRGLAAGTAGPLKARLGDGRSAEIRLRPLSGGRTLEVVLHLRREA